MVCSSYSVSTLLRKIELSAAVAFSRKWNTPGMRSKNTTVRNEGRTLLKLLSTTCSAYVTTIYQKYDETPNTGLNRYHGGEVVGAGSGRCRAADTESDRQQADAVVHDRLADDIAGTS